MSDSLEPYRQDGPLIYSTTRTPLDHAGIPAQSLKRSESSHSASLADLLSLTTYSAPRLKWRWIASMAPTVTFLAMRKHRGDLIGTMGGKAATFPIERVLTYNVGMESSC